MARLAWLSSSQVLNIEGLGDAGWKALHQAHHFEHLFSWLALTQEQLQHTPGLSAQRGLRLWHQFNQARRQPFTRWLEALGVPVPRVAMRALGDRHWQQLQSRDPLRWQQVQGIGVEKARRLAEFIHHPTVNALTSWLNEQGVPGF
ncbi:MAG TPA: hypothetical protein DEF92_15535 [Leclercia adecarboxylata]|nr:hypothetical protein [Leclercia adecarboxylata]